MPRCSVSCDRSQGQGMGRAGQCDCSRVIAQPLHRELILTSQSFSVETRRGDCGEGIDIAFVGRMQGRTVDQPPSNMMDTMYP